VTVERPTRAKKNLRPAKAVLDYSIQRRTSEQVKDDQVRAKKDAAAAAAAAIAHKQSQLDQVAALEDAMQAKDTAQSLEDLRPDLCMHRLSASSTEDNILSDSHALLDDPVGSDCSVHDTLIDIPPQHSLYRESSHSEEYLTGWEEPEDFENNEDKDKDYVMLSDKESEGSQDRTQYGESGSAPKARGKSKQKVRLRFYLIIHIDF
jgi:hypothetical protein